MGKSMAEAMGRAVGMTTPSPEDMQNRVNEGQVKWRPGMKWRDTAILPPIGSGYNPAESMEWAKSRVNTAKSIYGSGADEVPPLAQALRTEGGPDMGSWGNVLRDPSRLNQGISFDLEGGDGGN